MSRKHTEILEDFVNGITTDINYRLRNEKYSRKDMYLAGMLSSMEVEMELPLLCVVTDFTELKKHYGVTRHNIEDGMEIVDRGFMIAGSDIIFPKNMLGIDIGTVVMLIFSKGKHRAIDVSEVLGGFSHTFILGKTTKFTVKGVANKKGITYIELEIS